MTLKFKAIQILEWIGIYSISICLGLGSSFLIIFKVFKNGSQTWKKKQRGAPPRILNQEKWGTHHYLILKEQGIKVHYVEKGNKRNPLLLCLHGFPQCWFSWRHQLEEFSSQFWVVALDMRGYGDSDKPTRVCDYTIDILVEDVKRVILELGRTKCSLLAHDWGGIVAWRCVEKHPNLFQRHISINSPEIYTFNSVVRGSFAQLCKSWYIFLFQVPLLPEILFGLNDFEALEEMYRGPKKDTHLWSDEVLEAYKYYCSLKGGLKYPIYYYRSAMWDPPLVDAPKINVPTLIIWGTEDEALSKEIPKRMTKLCSDIQLRMVEGGRHFLHEEETSHVNKLIWDYVNITN